MRPSRLSLATSPLSEARSRPGRRRARSRPPWPDRDQPQRRRVHGPVGRRRGGPCGPGARPAAPARRVRARPRRRPPAPAGRRGGADPPHDGLVVDVAATLRSIRNSPARSSNPARRASRRSARRGGFGEWSASRAIKDPPSTTCRPPGLRLRPKSEGGGDAHRGRAGMGVGGKQLAGGRFPFSRRTGGRPGTGGTLGRHLGGQSQARSLPLNPMSLLEPT